MKKFITIALWTALAAIAVCCHYHEYDLLGTVLASFVAGRIALAK